jgi:phosphoglycolate phosphatase-like HAD superfamily hydrolase
VRDIAAEAYDEAFSAAIGDTLAFSGTSVPAWVRIYDEMADLIGALQDDGFDVWIVSASPQNVVEAVAELVGVAHNHVIGIRTTTAGGRLTATLQSCNGDSDLITFNLGKRCWINKVIFSDEVSGTTTNDTAHLPTFVAGDSDTDIAMIKDASVLKLAINRNKIQLMCNAFSNYLGRWIVQPMFISPKACRTTLYACSTALDTAGNFIVDEAGMTMADQADAVCLLP